jgi:hypothetical protein
MEVGLVTHSSGPAQRGLLFIIRSSDKRSEKQQEAENIQVASCPGQHTFSKRPRKNKGPAAQTQNFF